MQGEAKLLRAAAVAVGCVPGAAQHEVMRCRPGTVPNSAFGTVPDQRCTATRKGRFALHRIRDTSYCALMPAFAITAAQRFTSTATSRWNCSPLMLTGSKPS